MIKRISLSMILVLAIMLTFVESVRAQSTWTKQTAPVMTPWGEQLTADNVWQEYPRPSMKRQEWMNLNGVWKYFKRTSINYDYERDASSFSKAILVPFPVESALSGIMDKSYSSNRRATHMYRRTFTLPDAFSDKNVLLHFGAVDWRCYIYVNGQLAGTHDGGSVSFVEPVSPTHIENYEPIPDIDNSTVSIKVKTSEPCSVTLTVKDGGNTIVSSLFKIRIKGLFFN